MELEKLMKEEEFVIPPPGILGPEPGVFFPKEEAKEYEIKVWQPGILGPEPGVLFPEELRKPVYFIVEKQPQEKYAGAKEPIEEKKE